MKHYFIFSFYLISVCIISTNANAALGLPDKTARLGYSLGVARVNIDEPAGRAQDAYTTQPFKLIYTDWQKGGNRYWAELFYYDTALRATEQKIGQHLKHSGANLLLQKNIALNSVIRPWIGAGIGISVVEYEKRHTIDDEGYLLDSFPDRKSETIGALLSVVNEWQVSRDWTIGGSLLQRISFNNAITETSLSMYFLVRY